MDDVRRLRLVSAFQEIRLGLLRLSVGDGFATSTSLAYNLNRLHSAYRDAIDYRGDGILEFWREGRKIGEFTNDGLLLGPEYSQPR